MKGTLIKWGIFVIEIKGVTKMFGKKKVLNGVSFTAEKRGITCLIGINGVGKTTIMKAIMALTPINSGEILIDGEKITKESYEKITFIPDTMMMLPQMKIRDAFVFMADFYDCWNKKRATELLQFYKLKETYRISELSKGNTAKVNLLLGLALDVDYVLIAFNIEVMDKKSKEVTAMELDVPEGKSFSWINV